MLASWGCSKVAAQSNFEEDYIEACCLFVASVWRQGFARWMSSEDLLVALLALRRDVA